MNPHFASLVLGLAHQAEAALAGSLPPGAEGAGDARALAQTLIDTLGMLVEKTEGRLDPDERQLLDQALTALRFRFVQTAPALVSRRAAIIVLDGLGIGPAPDTDAYGDAGSNTLGNVARAVGGLSAAATSRRSGSARCAPLAGRRAGGQATGRVRRRRAGERRQGQHHRSLGAVRPGARARRSPPIRTGFPAEVIAEFARRTGRGVLAQQAGVGDAGARRVRRGAPADRQVDRLHLGRQRLPGGGARGHGAAEPSSMPPARRRARCCRASTACRG